jgi:hypothetical protein
VEQLAKAPKVVLVRVRQDEDVEVPVPAGVVQILPEARHLVVLGVLGLVRPVAHIREHYLLVGLQQERVAVAGGECRKSEVAPHAKSPQDVVVIPVDDVYMQMVP